MNISPLPDTNSFHVNQRHAFFREVRILLDRAGMDVGDVFSDVLDEDLITALGDFQKSRGLPVSETIDSATWVALHEASFLLGDRLLCLTTPMTRGEDIAELQLLLGRLGFHSGRVDGIFGPETQHGVETFQRDAGLTADQICGPETVQALRQLSAKTGPTDIASVLDRERLRRHQEQQNPLVVGLVGSTRTAALIEQIAAAFNPVHAIAKTFLHDDEHMLAQFCNEHGVDVVLGIEQSDEPVFRVAFFGSVHYVSVIGQRIGELLQNRLPRSPYLGPAALAGMRRSVLRETQAPAVLLTIGAKETDSTFLDLCCVSIADSLSLWFTTPPKK